MNVYRKEYQVLSSDTDMMRRLRLSVLFTWMQEAAIADTIRLGVPRAKTLDRGLLWVVTQYRAQITRMPSYDETVTLQSWPGRTMHLFFPRHFMLVGESGDILVKAVSVWVLIDMATRQIVFPEEHDISIDEIVTGDELPFPARLRPGKTDRTVPFTVPYSYVDLNGHMNNARYFDLASDCMPSSLARRMPREAAVDFIGEIKPDEEISLHFSAEDDCMYLCGEKGKDLFRMWFSFAFPDIA